MIESPISLSSKLPRSGTSIFAVMSGLAREHNAINLSQGFPDFDVDPVLIDRVHHYMQKGMNQYAPMPGVMELRRAIAEKVERLYGVQYDIADEITVTPGATYGIYAAISSVVKEGDEVIIFTPAYDCYGPAVELNGGKPVYLQLQAPDYRIDWEEVKQLINHKTRMIMINTPHNPSGTVMTAEDLKTLEQITAGSDILILSDEVYEHVIFDNVRHESVMHYPELVKRSFVVFSFGKTFHATGWKMGYCLAPGALMAEFRKVHQFQAFSVNTPTQYALADYLENKENYENVASFYEKKRDRFVDLVSGSRFSVIPAGGTYFQSLGYSNITDEDDEAFARRLTVEHKIASIPVSVFYHQKRDDKMLRFCFAKGDDTLERAAEILCRI